MKVPCLLVLGFSKFLKILLYDYSKPALYSNDWRRAKTVHAYPPRRRNGSRNGRLQQGDRGDAQIRVVPHRKEESEEMQRAKELKEREEEEKRLCFDFIVFKYHSFLCLCSYL